MNGRIIICPNEEKLKLLKLYSNDKNITNIKFFTKKEFLSEYYYSYDEKTLFYLMKKYNYHIDVCKKYLNNLYFIDINKDYQSSKLLFLKNLKQELIDNNLLYYNNNFSKYLEDKEIVVKHYYDLDLYEEKAFNTIINMPSVKVDSVVNGFNTMEDEVNFVCLKIIELIKKGISLDKICLCNVSDDYFYTIEKLFSYYNIPINIPYKRSIFGTKIVQDYLNNNILNLEDVNPITKKLVEVINSLSFLDLSDEVSKKILIDKLKHTYLDNKTLKKAVSIKDLFLEDLDEYYVFVLGFNQDVLPRMAKDIDFISDKEKCEVNLYDNNYLNKREKEIVAYLLSKINNLYLSFKLSSPFSSYYPSSLIDELGLEVIYDNNDNYEYSNIYNKIRLGEKLDLYHLYGEKDDSLELLNNHYNIPYLKYDNGFTGINLDKYLINLDYPLKLSYTSLNAYNECKFKYYVRHVLRLDEFKDTFASFIGSLYHKILSLYNYPNFDFEKEYDKYLESRELSLKEMVLLVRIKKDLLEFLDVLKKQQLLTGYDEFYFEKKIEVPIEKDVSVLFVGYVDKIMYYRKIEDTYFSIIDYKTGTIDTHIEPMKYGLHMQLPIYLYLLHYGKVFSNPIFTGIYYQNILFDYPKWEVINNEKWKEKYYLNGYSTDDVSILERFDSTYEKSEYIKSMKYNPEKGFDRFSKVLSNDTLIDMLKYTKEHISLKVDEILKGDFSINPKVYNQENIACRFCSFKDLCFMKDRDLVYLEKQDDLSFLGGDVE